MNDKSQQLLLAALSQAFAHRDGLPLHGSKATPGLFPGSAIGKQVAERGRLEGFFDTYLPADSSASKRSRGGPKEHAKITEKGIDHLLENVSPRQVLEDLVRTLEFRQEQIESVRHDTASMLEEMVSLRSTIETVLESLQKPGPNQNGSADPMKRMSTLFFEFVNGAGSASPIQRANPVKPKTGEALHRLTTHYLKHWNSAQRLEDCPLPTLCQQLRTSIPDLTLGEFHDALRYLDRSGRIYLHPWTGPMHALPYPQFALLVGHEIAYYASLRE